MAIYRFEVKAISRKVGRSATAAAAYRTASRLEDERTGEVHDYRRKRDVVHSEILLAQDAPVAFKDRAHLWNAAEAAERRKDAKVAREIIASLPHELDAKARTETARAMAQHIVDRYGVAVEMSVHAPHRKGDQRNWHCHLLFTTRRLGAEGLGAKTRQLDVKQSASQEVTHLRQQWADYQNRSLERAGSSERVDHRSLEARGIERAPEPKLGPVATEMERAGRRSHAGEDVRTVRAENAALQAALAQRQVIDLAIERERRQAQTRDREAAARQRQIDAKLAAEQQRVSVQAQALQRQLAEQGRLQRFWCELTRRNAHTRQEIEALRSSAQTFAKVWEHNADMERLRQQNQTLARAVQRAAEAREQARASKQKKQPDRGQQAANTRQREGPPRSGSPIMDRVADQWREAFKDAHRGDEGHDHDPVQQDRVDRMVERFRQRRREQEQNKTRSRGPER